MKTTSFRPVSTSIIAAAFALTLIAYGVVSASAQSRSAATPSMIFDPDGGMVIFPRTSIIQWNDSVARFDSATGAIHRFSGQLHNPPTKAEWVMEVPPVRERHSGMLRFQRAEGKQHIDVPGERGASLVPFLVDVVTGDTWILRAADVRPRWDKVELAPR